MMVFGGFIKQKGQYTNNLNLYKFSTNEWQREFSQETSPKSKQPCGRCNASMVHYKDTLYIFGGMNGNKKLNDFWAFDCINKVFTKLPEQEHTPCERSGHDAIIYKDKMFLFGGIQDLTKEKNDLFYYDFPTKKWHLVFESVSGLEVDKNDRQE